MKKLSSLLLALLACITFTNAESIDLLDSTITVNESSVFGHSKTLYEYNNKGSLIRQTRIYATWSKWTVGVPMILNRKSVFVYDDEGHEIDLYYSTLDTATGKWADDHRYLYDEWHNRIYGVGKWNADSTALLAGTRYLFDTNHFCIGYESFDTWNGVEVIDCKYFYTNDANGYRISMYGQFRPDSAYDGDYKSDPDKFNQSGWKNVDSMYYERNAAGQSTRETVFRWDESNNQWLKDGYQDFTYDAQGHWLTDTVFARDFETNIITYNNMTVREYDSYGNLTRTTTYLPVFSEGSVQWQVNDVSVNEYTYNDKGQITLKRSYTNWNDGTEPKYSTTTYFYSHYELDENGNIVPEPCLIASGTCGAEGDNLTWELSCAGVLTISGTGAMADFTAGAQPWAEHVDAITGLVLTEGVTHIGKYAFNRHKLSSLVLPNSLQSIGALAFEYAELDSVFIPDNVTEIGGWAFAGSHAAYIYIGDGLTTLTGSVFYPCTGIYAVSIGTNLVSIDDGGFNGGPGLREIHYRGTLEDWLNKPYKTMWGNYALYLGDELQTDVTFPDELTTIPTSVFYGCSSLHTVTIPASVKIIEKHAFYKCSALESITCYGQRPPTVSDNGLYGLDYSTIVYVPAEYLNNYILHDTWGLYDVRPIPEPEPWIEDIPVTFLDYNSVVLSEQLVKYNQAAQAPEVPTREGYTFVGWNVDIEHITAQTFAIAQYDKIGGTLTYLSEDGDVIATENVDLHLPEAPAIDGKSFKGWLTESADSENGIVLRATYTSDKPDAQEDVTVTPSSNSAYVIFPFITGALTYQLVIRDLFGHVVCKIMFSATGHLLGVAFAPSRNQAQQTSQTTGFNFTVEGLDPSTTYEYEFVANDDTDEVIETLSGSFTTTAKIPTDNEQVDSPSTIRKYLEDGHLMIDANSHIFNTQGKMVK